MHSTHLARQGRGLEHSSTYIGTPAATKGLLLREQIHPFRLHLLSLLSRAAHILQHTYKHISSHL